MRHPDLAEMNAFVAVAEQHSFAKAATRLGISRSRLSETVSGLEARLGVRLLNRTTRSVSLTVAGERLLARMRPLLDEFAATLDSVNEFRDKPSGLLRLTVPPPAASFVLAPIIARFLAEYPAISLDISVDSSLTDIVAARFDAGIRLGERIARDMIALPIGWESNNVVAAAPSYLANHPLPQTPGDLAAHDCLRFRFGSGVFVPWLFERKGKRIEVAVEGRLIVNEPELAIHAALDGAGLIYTPVDYIAAHIAAKRLVPLLEDWQFRRPGLFLYYPSRRQIPAPLRAFITFLRKNVRR